MQGFYFNVFSLKDLSNPYYLEQKRQKLDTAHHEHGHAIAAGALGWKVEIISIARDGDTLGFTRAVPGIPKPIEELLLDKITICYAGMAAEALMGNNDHGQEKNAIGGILQSGWQRAWDIMQSNGKTHIDNVSFPMLNNPVKT